MRVRIINDGQPGYMTRLTNAETNEPIEHATAIEVDLTIGTVRDLPHAIITTVLPAFDVIADAEIREVCPCCGKPTQQETILPHPLEDMVLSAIQQIISGAIAEYRRVKASEVGDVTDYRHQSTRHPAYDL